MRKTIFGVGEYYHVYNRGVDKRNIVMNQEDSERFVLSMTEFNVVDPIGSIYEHRYATQARGRALGSLASKSAPLVEFITRCLNPNHYHFVLKQLVDGGIQEFMHRLGTGYTNYFNERYDRTGSLFQGPYKARRISSNEDLLNMSAYSNLNNRVHGIEGPDSVLVRSSWGEYMGTDVRGICETSVILSQFATAKDYELFCEDALANILERKENEKELKALLLE